MILAWCLLVLSCRQSLSLLQCTLFTVAAAQDFHYMCSSSKQRRLTDWNIVFLSMVAARKQACSSNNHLRTPLVVVAERYNFSSIFWWRQLSLYFTWCIGGCSGGYKGKAVIVVVAVAVRDAPSRKTGELEKSCCVIRRTEATRQDQEAARERNIKLENFSTVLVK